MRGLNRSGTGRERVVIAGAGYAGSSCALRLARLARDRADIVLVGASERFVERIRLHQRAVGQTVGEWELERLLRGSGVRLQVGRVEGVVWSDRALVVDGRPLPWDTLVLALGSRVDVGSVPGVRRHAVVLEADTTPTVHRCLRLLADRGGRVAVVGTGLSGIEAAAEIAESFPSLVVELVGRDPPGGGWSDAARAYLQDALRELGVTVHAGVDVQRVERDRLETDRGALPFDLCLWAAGFVADPLAGRIGLAVNGRGQLLVDACLRSITDRAVYAAGDVASLAETAGIALPLGCKSAMPTGAHVADNIARRLRGEAERPLEYATLFWCVSLGRRAGLIQMMDRDGAPRGRILTGRAGAIFKEAVCRATMWALRLERRGRAGIVWKRLSRAAGPLAPGAESGARIA